MCNLNIIIITKKIYIHIYIYSVDFDRFAGKFGRSHGCELFGLGLL